MDSLYVYGLMNSFSLVHMQKSPLLRLFRVCNFPESGNPFDLSCNAAARRKRFSSNRFDVQKYKNPKITENELLERVQDYIDPDDIIVRRSDRGVYFEASESLKVRNRIISFK